MVNIIVADMVQSEGRIPQRLTKEKYALGIILQDFSLLFGSETPSKLLEKWPTSFKAKVVQQAEMLTSTPLLKRLLLSAKNQRGDEPSLESPEWDSDMASILLLLHLLSPQPAGRKVAVPGNKQPFWTSTAIEGYFLFVELHIVRICAL
ncbi:hypothetical protein KUCAC02_022328 [Chaenocephalus aceratus]|uniref:Uncharacterized protein n=1 Tax=Chaenocephalus aceratus TaxID=36190 RepID=A0ACB9XMN7_CHAAC|nr:hypothetical protein KUCAC02_022328 [Chaenocephalus aceratus]